MTIARRHFVTGASAAVLAAGLAGCGSEERDPTPAPQPPPPPPIEPGADLTDTDMSAVDDELVAAFLAESFNEGETPSQTNQIVTSWEELRADPDLLSRAKTVVEDVGSAKLKAKLVEDAESPDFVRFTTPDFGEDGKLASGKFVLTAALLRSIADSSGYTAALAEKPTVLFGLRGCSLPTGDKGAASGESIEVSEATIDHVRRRCLIGVWDTATGNIQVFSGSTVPNLVNMQYYLFWRFSQTGASTSKWTRGRTMACLLPQGLHTYEVGVHLRNEKEDRQQAGALLQTTPTPILRARSDVGYTLFDEWDPLDWEPGGGESGVRAVGINIHAGVNRNLPPYASKGCQTIYGWYSDGATPTELWKDFQQGLGVFVSKDAEGKATFTKRGSRFPYMLTTGREARLHAAAADDGVKLGALKSLRLGSRGPGAMALRTFLGQSAGESVDGQTMLSLLKWQKSRDLAPDGVLTKKLDADWQIGAL